MSGVQVWTNAVFLFVNVSTGDNVFLDGGRQITWFAQNTMTMASPAVVRLIHHATGFPVPSGKPVHADESVAHAPCDVVLVCRIGTEPYIWAGRLEHVRHDPRSRPIKFWWRLREYDALITKPAFREVLRHSSSE